jgi:undecaprenyl-diphosphatase
MLQSPRQPRRRPDAEDLQSLPDSGAAPFFHHGPIERIHARVIGALYERFRSRAAIMIVHVILSALAAAACIAILVLVSRWVLSLRSVHDFEESIVTAIAEWRTVELVDVAHEVSALGGSVPAGIIIVAFAALLWLRGWRYSAISLVVTMAGGMFLNFLLKFPFDRPRPLAMVEDAQVHTTSYPSGHALVATICYGGIAWIAARMTREKKIRVSHYLTALFVITTVCIGRVFLGTHFVSDVVAGLLAGIIWIATILAGLAVLGVVRGRG